MWISKLKQSINLTKQKKFEFLCETKDYLKLLKNGLYLIDCYSGIIFKCFSIKKYAIEKESTYNGRHSSSNKKNKIKDFLLHTKLIRIRNKNTDFNFSLGILSSKKDVFKLFDYKNGILVSLFKDKTKKDLILDNAKSLKKNGYAIPDITDSKNILEENYSITTKLITKKPFDYEDGFFSILKSFAKRQYINAESFDHTANAKIETLKRYLSDNSLTLELEIFNKISKSIPYIQIISHGDLYPLNLLFDGTHYYIVDYEDVGLHIFFYDLMKYIVVTYTGLNDDTLLINYYLGKYDNQFADIFSKFNIPFDKKAKHLYLIMFIFELYNFEINYSFKDQIRKLTKYKT